MSRDTVRGHRTASLPTFENPWIGLTQETHQPASFFDRTGYQRAGGLEGGDVDSPLRSNSHHSSASEITYKPYCPSPNLSIHSFELNLTPSSSESDLPSTSRSQVQPTTMLSVARIDAVAKPTSMQSVFDINSHPPFHDPMESLGTQPYDVIKIRNVPFAVTVAEIKAFVNRLTTSPVIRDHQQGYPVHIIMERSTGKTMDCFVEFQHKGAAAAAVRRAEDTTFEGKIIKMGSRRVDVELSSEGELCAALFPRAKSVHWDKATGIPTILENQDPFSEGFQGFLTVEEVSSICKHSSNPQKSTFMQRCQQRVYESMISTLYKFPWHVPKYYFVNTRNFLWSAYMELLRNLMARVRPDPNYPHHAKRDKEVGLSHSLLMEYIFAGLNVQMFSMRQKFMIVHASGSLGPGFPLPKQAMAWPFHTLIPSTNHASDIIDEWLNILDTGYQRCVVHRLSHGYEDYLELGRDESGSLRIELSDSGRELTFHDLISVEKGLMEVLVDNGRKEYCLGYGLPYKPLNLWENPAPAEEYSTYEASMNPLQLTRIDGQYYENASEVNSDGLGPLMTNYQHSPPDDLSVAAEQEMHHLYSERSNVQCPSFSHFNPATPSFIPRQPWAGVSNSHDHGNQLPPSDQEQTLARRHDLSFVLAPSWASPQELPSGHKSNDPRNSAPTASYDVRTSATRYDPFSSDASPQAPRRTSVRSRHSSASGSPAGSDGLTGDANIGGGNEIRHSAARGKIIHALPPKPIFGSVWGPTVLRAGSVPINATGNSARRAFSADSGSVADRTHYRQVDAVSAVSHPKAQVDPSTANYLPLEHIKSAKLSTSGSKGVGRALVNDNAAIDVKGPESKSYTHAAIASADPNYSALQEKASPWVYGSPSHGSKSRSSSNRKFVKIQATIDEEGDLSAAETVDCGDDAATDAGGVSLRTEN